MTPLEFHREYRRRIRRFALNLFSVRLRHEVRVRRIVFDIHVCERLRWRRPRYSTSRCREGRKQFRVRLNALHDTSTRGERAYGAPDIIYMNLTKLRRGPVQCNKMAAHRW